MNSKPKWDYLIRINNSNYTKSSHVLQCWMCCSITCAVNWKLSVTHCYKGYLRQWWCKQSAYITVIISGMRHWERRICSMWRNAICHWFCIRSVSGFGHSAVYCARYPAVSALCFSLCKAKMFGRLGAWLVTVFLILYHFCLHFGLYVLVSALL